MFLIAITLSAASADGLTEANNEQVAEALYRAGAKEEVNRQLAPLVAEQLVGVTPLGLTDGAWIVSLDLDALLQDRTVAAAVARELAIDGLALPKVLDLDGVAFVPADVAGELEDLGEYSELADELLKQKATDIWWGGICSGGIVTILAEAIGKLMPEPEDTRPEDDYDGDGRKNQDDPDDDNDGVPDSDDEYPFDDGRDICDLCGGDSLPGFADISDTLFFTEGPDSELLTELTVESITVLVESRGAAGLVVNNF